MFRSLSFSLYIYIYIFPAALLEDKILYIRYDIPHFNADRPFLYAIRSSSAALFVGRYAQSVPAMIHTNDAISFIEWYKYFADWYNNVNNKYGNTWIIIITIFFFLGRLRVYILTLSILLSKFDAIAFFHTEIFHSIYGCVASNENI